jgi:hypothetical protein
MSFPVSARFYPDCEIIANQCGFSVVSMGRVKDVYTELKLDYLYDLA